MRRREPAIQINQRNSATETGNQLIDDMVKKWETATSNGQLPTMLFPQIIQLRDAGARQLYREF